MGRHQDGPPARVREVDRLGRIAAVMRAASASHDPSCPAGRRWKAVVDLRAAVTLPAWARAKLPDQDRSALVAYGESRDAASVALRAKVGPALLRCGILRPEEL